MFLYHHKYYSIIEWMKYIIRRIVIGKYKSNFILYYVHLNLNHKNQSSSIYQPRKFINNNIL